MPIIHNQKETLSKRRILRRASTPQEIILWSRLRSNQTGFKFRRQHGVGKYILDFYCSEKGLAIEIDGSQHFKNDAVEYDNRRTQFLESLGIRVLRFTNTDVNANIEGVLMKIISELDLPHSNPLLIQ
jgi:very-short-patch-repair endonuclease